MSNNIIKRTWKQGGLVNIEDLRGSAFQAEDGGHTFLISGVDENGDALALSGTPAGVLLRADGQDVTLTCSVSEGVVSATLPANAYVVPGRVGITIFLTSGGQKTAIYAAVGSVATTSSGIVAPPAGSDVVDLVNAIATAVATIPASYTDLMAAVAPTYSTSALYAVGSYAWYSGKLYRCTTAITSGETWTSAHWTLANLGSDVSDLKSAMSVLTKYQSSSFGSGTATAANKRLLLNYEKAIPSEMFIGDLYLVANDVNISTTVKIELAKKNENGSYTVYDSVSTTLSITPTVGELIKVCSINKNTQYETYVFITMGTASRFRLASITGKYFVVGDDIESTTFTTRNVDNYEMDYLLYVGTTSDYTVEINENIKNLKTGLGDYEYYEFYNASQSSGFWNSYIYKNIPSGSKVRITLLSNTANLSFNVRAYDSSNNNQLIQGIFKDVGGTTEAKLTLNAVSIRLQASISSAITNAKISVIVSTDTEPGIVGDLFRSSVPRVYHVEKDGSGDFTNLATAIDVATQWMDSIVYVGAGTWDILSDLGQDYLDSASATNQGIVLKNRVHVICSSKAYIKCLYDGTDADIIDHISAFNAGPYGFTLENADIEVANVRYCVHDERNAETDHYDNYYINCRMKNTNQTPGSRSQCIGGGLGYDGHIVIDGCTFENPLRENYGVVSYHNAHGLDTDSRSLIEVKGCYFYGKNTFRAGYYGNSTAITQCLIHGNSMGAEPYMTQEDQSFTNVNMEIVAWNNEIRNT